MGNIPVIDLSMAPGEKEAWGRSRLVVYLWAFVELLFVTNAMQVSSRLRIAALRAFGAEIGKGVIFRPRTRVKFPWNLKIGDRSWIGEGVWFHNQAQISIGSDVVISQETMLTTGSHAFRKDMALVTSAIVIEDGVWVTSRCFIIGGSHVGKSALVTPMSVVRGDLPQGKIFGGNPAHLLGDRFD